MATTACGLAHGSLLLPLLRYASATRGAATGSALFTIGTSTVLSSSDLPRRSGTDNGGISGRWAARISPARALTDDRVDLDENPEGILSGEWPENFSLLCYDDLRSYLETQIVEEKPALALLGEVMSTTIRSATVDQTLEEIDHHFGFVSGLPVLDGELRCIGVISRTDKARALHGMKSMVGEVMSSPAVTLTPDKTVMDAASLMLKMKIHRIPILNEERQVIGMITRTDLLEALQTVVVV